MCVAFSGRQLSLRHKLSHFFPVFHGSVAHVVSVLSGIPWSEGPTAVPSLRREGHPAGARVLVIVSEAALNVRWQGLV